MSSRGLQQEVDALLKETNELGGYPSSLVCTDEGLVIASAGEVDDEDTAAFVSLFDDVLMRARRDLGFAAVDEVTLLDPGRGRTVIRPLAIDSANHTLFLVVRVPTRKTWRRHTNTLVKRLGEVLLPLVEGVAA